MACHTAASTFATALAAPIIEKTLITPNTTTLITCHEAIVCARRSLQTVTAERYLAIVTYRKVELASRNTLFARSPVAPFAIFAIPTLIVARESFAESAEVVPNLTCALVAERFVTRNALARITRLHDFFAVAALPEIKASYLFLWQCLEPGKVGLLVDTETLPERWKVVDVHVATGDTKTPQTTFLGAIEQADVSYTLEDIIARQPRAACEVQTFK